MLGAGVERGLGGPSDCFLSFKKHTHTQEKLFFLPLYTVRLERAWDTESPPGTTRASSTLHMLGLAEQAHTKGPQTLLA